MCMCIWTLNSPSWTSCHSSLREEALSTMDRKSSSVSSNEWFVSERLGVRITRAVSLNFLEGCEVPLRNSRRKESKVAVSFLAGECSSEPELKLEDKLEDLPELDIANATKLKNDAQPYEWKIKLDIPQSLRVFANLINGHTRLPKVITQASEFTHMGIADLITKICPFCHKEIPCETLVRCWINVGICSHLECTVPESVDGLYLTGIFDFDDLEYFMVCLLRPEELKLVSQAGGMGRTK